MSNLGEQYALANLAVSQELAGKWIKHIAPDDRAEFIQSVDEAVIRVMENGRAMLIKIDEEKCPTP